MESVLQSLRDFAPQELTIKENIEELRKDHQHLQSTLKDADARGYKEKQIQRLLWKIRGLSYRIQDVLETYDVKIVHSEGKSIYKAYRTIPRIMEDTEKLKSLVREIMENFNWLISDITNRSDHQGDDDSQQSTKRITDMPEKDFVGMGKSIDHLVSILIGKDRSRPFISIYGMFGTGKTALAKKLYNHSDVKDHFKGFAWIDLGKIVERKEILQKILKQLLHQGLEEEIEKNDEENDEELEFIRLNHILQKNKCLVVLDGIESLDALEVVRVAFTSKGNISKILLTTRMREIAETVAVAGNGYIHQMSGLTEEDCLTLFKRKLPGTARGDLHGSKMMEEIGKGIVRQYKGLPLAIVTIRDFIASNKYYPLEEWENIRDGIESFMVDTKSTALESIFMDLPYHLKPCFRYLSCFPEQYRIEAEKLYLLWIAEDMIASENRDGAMEENKMEIAEEYLKQLQLRSLVDIEEEEVPTFRRFKSCYLHGLMRKWCLSEEKRNGFIKAIEVHNENQEEAYVSKMVRWLIICLGKNVKRFPNGCLPPPAKAKHLRCLRVYDTDENLQASVALQDLLRLIIRFPVLRILDFNGVAFADKKLPRGISKLKLLRYLSFKNCHLREGLPEDISNLPYLEVLDLRVSTEMMIPNILWKLKRLRHLYFPETFRISSSRDRLQLNALTELKTLENLSTNLCEVEDIQRLTNLRFLLASDTHGNLGGLQELVKRMSMVTDHMLYCSIKVGDFDCYTEERHSVFRQLLGGRALHTFSIKGYLGEMPPDLTISQRLAKIVFRGSELKQNAMLTLEKLPNLQVLVFDEEAFVGTEISLSTEGFQELRRFELSNLSALKKLTVKDRALPKLSVLTIQKSCAALEELTIADEAFPKLSAFEIESRAALKTVKMPPRLKNCFLRKQMENSRDSKNMPSTTIICLTVDDFSSHFWRHFNFSNSCRENINLLGIYVHTIYFLTNSNNTKYLMQQNKICSNRQCNELKTATTSNTRTPKI